MLGALPLPMQRLQQPCRWQQPRRCRSMLQCLASKKQQQQQQQQQQQPAAAAATRPQLQLQQQLCNAAAAATAASLLLCGSATAAAPEATFAVKCVGCHVNGGNIVQPGATLFTADLQKNGFADASSLYNLIYSGKGRMPGFGADCAPKGQCTFGPRLTDDEVRELAQYVLDRAAEDWRQ